MVKKYFVLLVLFGLTVIYAQTDVRSMGSDELFAAARRLAFTGKRDSARVLLNMALAKTPQYSEIRVFLARTYAWDARFVDARKEIGYVLLQDPANREAESVAIDIELWDHNPQKALELCVRNMREHPNNQPLLAQKIRALIALHRDEEAMVNLSILEEINPSNPEIEKLKKIMNVSYVNQSLTVNETYDGIDKRSASHLAYIQYQRSTVLGTGMARVNVARRFARNGIQAEIDLYPVFGNGFYAYLNYGYSDPSLWTGAGLFPRHRGGAEFFFKLPDNFEASVGVRYLNFGTGNDVTLYTGAIGYYYRDYWFSFRPYITPQSISFSRSFDFTTRYYYTSVADEYLFLKLGEGYSPDDRNYDPANGSVYFLKAQNAEIGIQSSITTVSTMIASVKYTSQQPGYGSGAYESVYTLMLGYRYKF